MATETYNRPHKHNHGKTHTCPCCLRPIRTTKNGVIMRHGWKEEGRQHGVYGQGYQWGNCVGWQHLPIEISDRSALKFAEDIEKEAANVDLRAEERPERLGCSVHMYTSVYSIADLNSRKEVIAAQALGVTFSTSPCSYGLRVTASVPQGFEGALARQFKSTFGTTLKSYEELAEERKKSLKELAQALRTQALNIRLRCKKELEKGE